MPPRPDSATVDRLAKVAARLGSNFAGEQAAAATLGSGILAGFGLTWQELVQRAFQTAPQLPPRVYGPAAMPPHTQLARAAMRYPERLTIWEREFLTDISHRPRLTAKQGLVLQNIVHKLRRSGRT